MPGLGGNVKLTNSPVRLIIFIGCNNSLLQLFSPRPLTALFKPKSIMGYINWSHIAGAENEQVKQSKTCTLYDSLDFIRCLLWRHIGSWASFSVRCPNTSTNVHADTPQQTHYKEPRLKATWHSWERRAGGHRRENINKLILMCLACRHYFFYLSPWWLFPAAQRPAKLPAALIWIWTNESLCYYLCLWLFFFLYVKINSCGAGVEQKSYSNGLLMTSRVEFMEEVIPLQSRRKAHRELI